MSNSEAPLQARKNGLKLSSSYLTWTKAMDPTSHFSLSFLCFAVRSGPKPAVPLNWATAQPVPGVYREVKLHVCGRHEGEGYTCIRAGLTTSHDGLVGLMSVRGGASCALQGIEQCPWSPPSRYQELPLPHHDKNVSRHCHMSPGGQNSSLALSHCHRQIDR